MSRNRIIRRMEDLLQSQADCLRTGDLEGAMALAPKIEPLADRLERAGSDGQQALVRLGQLAERNLALIAAARRGVESAQTMLSEARREGQGFRSYDARGRSTRIGGIR